MARKVSYFSVFLIIIGSLLLPVARSATPNADFDGTYKGTFTMTAKVTVPTNPPKKISTTQTVPIKLVVHNGIITGWGNGSVTNNAGRATITVKITGYGKIVVTPYFTRNAATSVITFAGILNGSFPSARTVLSGKFRATDGEKFFFTVPLVLVTAQIGKEYPGVSLCHPQVKAGALCGKPVKSTNPSGGRPPYNFRLEVGSSLLPAGITLNSRTGLISGTAKAGQKPGVRHLVICAFDSHNWFTGACRRTTLTLTR